ncbi:MAG: LPXTG cell wall anchor domain-containing protein, partial [Erysipelotrichaceae bacterium]|nr:LPXTG cell wall anchor domain-containing protein [Erysipelotrichaceae bacterium]
KLPGAGQFYKFNTAYRITEAKAPDGYQLPDNPPVFYYWFSQGQTEPTEKPADFPSDAADISVGSYRATAVNQRSENVFLPETGGIGTEMFLITGALVAGISLFLLYRKTRSEMN